jgi:two-component system, LuxR family, response regulator FixJ
MSVLPAHSGSRGDCAMTDSNTVFVVDDDKDVRDSLRALLESAGHNVNTYLSAKALLSDDIAGGGCLITDIRMPDMDGLELQNEINRRDIGLPVIVITGHGDITLAIRAMKAGALDFLIKPFNNDAILTSVALALQSSSRFQTHSAGVHAALQCLALLTPRERQVFELLVTGRSNKIVGNELNISNRTVEVHRGHIFKKLNMNNLSDLVRISLSAGA